MVAEEVPLKGQVISGVFQHISIISLLGGFSSPLNPLNGGFTGVCTMHLGTVSFWNASLCPTNSGFWAGCVPLCVWKHLPDTASSHGCESEVTYGSVLYGWNLLLQSLPCFDGDSGLPGEGPKILISCFSFVAKTKQKSGIWLGESSQSASFVKKRINAICRSVTRFFPGV